MMVLPFLLLPSAVPDGPLSLGYELRFLDLAKYPLAVCNDGSPAAYYMHKGTKATRFVLHQQGGWWCWDDYSCQVRWDHFANHSTEFRTLMSTASLAKLTQEHDTFNGEKNTGIMAHNASANPMAAASKAFLVYCSSDSHAGNRTTSTPSGRTWHFRGKEIVRAVVAELAATERLAEATHFLLTGGSAGGMATLNNADWVGKLVKAAAPTARFVAMPDSGYFMDVMPGAMCAKPETYECKCAQGGGAEAGHSWLGPGQTLAQQAQNMLGYTGGLPDESCVVAHGRWGAWRCYLGQYAAAHLSTPTLLLQSQIDEWQGFWNGFFSYATDRMAYDYAAWFRTAQRTALVESLSASSNLRAFSPNCYHHGLSYDARFWSVRTGGWSAATMLEAMLDGSAGPTLAMDDCAGLPCSPETAAAYADECSPVERPTAAVLDGRGQRQQPPPPLLHAPVHGAPATANAAHSLHANTSQ